MADYNFIDVDSDVIYKDVIGSLMNYCREPLYPGDERRIFGEAEVSVFVAMYSIFNDKAKQRMLKYARGEVLDGIGDSQDVVRLQPAQATAIFRFTSSEAQTESIVIPQGTRITTDGSVYFATKNEAKINNGDTFVDVLAACEVGGAQYNDYAPSTIATLVDLIPYIEKVENITTTENGDDGEPYTKEGDDRFRERIRLAPSRVSVGTETSYIYHALSADADIIDIAIDTPSECVVNIYPLLKGGKLPDEETLKAVEAACNDSKARAMTDKVTAVAPTVRQYSVKVHYYVTMENEADAMATIEGPDGAVAKYNEWQQEKLGRDINPDYLRKLILAPESGIGADRVTVTEPTYQAIDHKEVAQLSGEVIVTHEVIT